ncbi:MAG: hypothetical protein JWM28_1877 [Chitinophagaceae bacterium]|nr:hypothetical protein [Chitinophagaceae bacterium]
MKNSKPFGNSFHKIFFLFAFSFLSQFIFSQTILLSDKKILAKKEDTLKVLAKKLSIDSMQEGRMRSDSIFIRTLIRTLQVKNSFFYPFDSVQGISKLYAPDSSFRIFSWNLSYDEYYSRQRGAIQMRTRDGSLKLIPLRDVSEFTENPMDSVRDKNNWIGSVYYRIIKTQYNGKNFYTLFGYDANSAMTNKKWIEVMTFNERNEPQFGGKYFSFEKDSLKRAVQFRFSIEYKKAASTTVNYEDEMKLILLDHLISESDEPEKLFTYVPDGDYEGFTWQNGKWVHIDKVFTYKLQDGQAPVGDPILDNGGNGDEKKSQNKPGKNKKQNEENN